jgi:hypothetical protein
MAMTQAEIDKVQAAFSAVRSDMNKRVVTSTLASTDGLAHLPPGTMVSATNPNSRPTTRADLIVTWYTATQPTAMLSGDQWVRTA